MDFARKILGKYGWKDGEGLGKNSNGIAKPLRATLKFDNAGFGADVAASDFNNHWWERVFNDAASNVEVKKDGDTITMDLVDHTDGVEISTKGYSTKKLKKAKKSRASATEKSESSYNNFLQAATLTNTGGEIENPDRIEAADIEVTKVKVLTDEELFKACGGRTAHKGARHGLKLSGKLARIEQQEKELLAKMLTKVNDVSEQQESKTKAKNIKKEKVDVSKEHRFEHSSCDHEKIKKRKRKLKPEDTLENTYSEPKKLQNKTAKKKKSYVPGEINHGTENQNSDNVSISETKSKKMKIKHKDSKIPEETTNFNVVLTPKIKKKNKCDVDDAVEEIPNPINKKKRNKTKAKKYQE